MNSIRKVIRKIINEQVDEFLGDVNIMSDYKGRDFSITREGDGLLKFDFDSMGWLFDTNDVGEGVAIVMGSKYAKDNGVREIGITQADKDNADATNALYWISGGNKLWRFGLDEVNVTWDEIKSEMTNEFGAKVKGMIDSSNTLGELIDKFMEFRNSYEIGEWMNDNHYLADEEENQD